MQELIELLKRLRASEDPQEAGSLADEVERLTFRKQFESR